MLLLAGVNVGKPQCDLDWKFRLFECYKYLYHQFDDLSSPQPPNNLSQSKSPATSNLIGAFRCFMLTEFHICYSHKVTSLSHFQCHGASLALSGKTKAPSPFLGATVSIFVQLDQHSTSQRHEIATTQGNKKAQSRCSSFRSGFKISRMFVGFYDVCRFIVLIWFSPAKSPEKPCHCAVVLPHAPFQSVLETVRWMARGSA